MVNLERYGVLFFVRFFCVFLAEEPYFFMPKYKHRRDGRKIAYTDVEQITADNIVNVVGNCIGNSHSKYSIGTCYRQAESR